MTKNDCFDYSFRQSITKVKITLQTDFSYPAEMYYTHSRVEWAG